MSHPNDEPMVRYLALSLIEAAINLALSHEPAALDRVRQRKGKVLRIKTTGPDWMFFVAMCDDGVHLFLDSEESADARLTLPFTLLAQYVLGSSSSDTLAAEGVRVSGDLELLVELMNAVQTFSLWRVCKSILGEWLPQYEGFTGLVEALKHNDPAWIVRLEHLPQLANELLVAMRAQAEVQQQQMAQIRAIQQQLDADRKANQVSTLIGFCLMLVAFLAHNGYLQVPAIQHLSLDTLILLILSVALLVPRLLRRR